MKKKVCVILRAGASGFLGGDAFTRFAVALCCLGLLLQGCAYLVREATIAYVAVKSHLSPNDIEIELHTSFIEKYKNKVTIDTTFTVDKTGPFVHPAFLDGDLHFSGRAPEVGFPTVGEIINAASEKEAVDLVRRLEGTGSPLRISGVWRLWPEHAGSADEEQGERHPPLESSNPDHVFEIHPVTRISAIELLASFRPVKGFKPGDARTVFDIYENARCALRVKPTTISLVTVRGLYNDVEFVMEVADERQLVVHDGRFVTASARDLKGNVLVERLRMVFVKDTPPERAVKDLRRGGRLHLHGIPRIDFSELSRRVTGYRKNPELLTRNLPYEIIVLGVFEDSN